MLAIISAFIYWVASSSDGGGNTTAASSASMPASAAISASTVDALSSLRSAAPRPAPPQSAAATCATDYATCKDNGDLVNNYDKIGDAQVACKVATDDNVKYGNPDWPWLPFGSYVPGNTYVKAGVVRLAEKAVQIQNGFGAMVHSEVVCDYDLKTHKVVMLNINGDPVLLGNDALLDLAPDDAASGASAAK
ncbi:hypothetical protein [Thiomonas intermedia]|uniref:hypothetical protein n=1 Tax=Thiomonas intermedia TaxID=926 RepID=UPI0012ABA09D|nr:hypothetical protein [Thiomonas intermedia]